MLSKTKIKQKQNSVEKPKIHLECTSCKQKSWIESDKV